MNFLWLEYFSAVVEEGSIRNAAARMYVSDQAVSEVVKKLERELGAQLLQRTRPQAVTPAGEALYRYAAEILDLKRQMVNEISERYADCRKDTVRIGISALGAPDFLPGLMAQVRKQIPGVRLELVRQSSVNARDFSGADLYFPLIPLDDSLEHVVLRRDAVCVMVSRQLLEKTYGASLEASVRELEGGRLPAFRALPFIDTRSAAASGFSQHQLCSEDEFRLSPLICTDSPETMLALCGDGYGAVIVMESEIRRHLSTLPPEQRKELRFYPLHLASGSADLAVSYRAGKRLSRLEQQFIQIAREFFRS